MKDKGIIVGIDIGLKGGIAIYDIHKNEFINLYKMPIITEGKYKKLDIKELYSILNKYDIKLLAIEKITNIYGVSKSTMFSLGKQIGIIISYCINKNIEYIEIPPKVWENYFHKNINLELNDDTILDNSDLYIDYCNKYNISESRLKSFCKMVNISPQTLEILSNHLDITMDKLIVFKYQKIKTMICLVDIYGTDLLKRCYNIDNRKNGNIDDGLVDSIMLVRYCIENNLK